jgi:hypothetical protein
MEFIASLQDADAGVGAFHGFHPWLFSSSPSGRVGPVDDGGFLTIFGGTERAAGVKTQRRFRMFSARLKPPQRRRPVPGTPVKSCPSAHLREARVFPL